MASASIVLKALACGVAFAAGPIAARAQPAPIVPDEFLEFERRTGNDIHFCLNMDSSLAEFDRAVAKAIADALLTGFEFHEIRAPLAQPYPHDYRFVIDEGELFIAVHNECDGLMGFYLPQSGTTPDWLTVTRPYFSPRYVLAVIEPAYNRLSDIPVGEAIASQIGSAGSAQIRSYNNALAASNRWQLQALPDNGLLVQRLLDGEVEAIMIWEPALYMATNGNPSAAGIRIADAPFDIARLNFSIALTTDSLYLRSLMDSAIDSLLEDGVIAEIATRFGLPAN